MDPCLQSITLDGPYESGQFMFTPSLQLSVDIGEVGWPSEGDNSTKGYANVENAATFNTAVLAHLLSGKGTPARPNQQIYGHLFSLTDEDRKATQAGAFERHWGLFRSDGQPKYNVDFTGASFSGLASGAAGVTSLGSLAGAMKNLTAAAGIPFYPSQWCVAKPDTTDVQLAKAMSYACGDGFASDCTPTLPGGSCYFDGNLSQVVNYAFNSFYQLNGQAPETCQFSGLGTIVTSNPSEDGCVFQIGINEGAKSAGNSIVVQGLKLTLLLLLCTSVLLFL